MADDFTVQNNLGTSNAAATAAAINQGANSNAGSTGAINTTQAQNAIRNTGKQVGKDEFLNLLVTQLKNQDPLDPIKNEDFAVQLATFSQLEQLIQINGKINTTSETSGGGSMASYLGNQVVLNSSKVAVKGGDAGSIFFNLESPAANVTMDLLNADGNIVESLDIGSFQKGPQTLALTDLPVINGEYEFKLNTVSPTGVKGEAKGYAAGTVTGFVPGPEPLLIVDGKEISPGEVKEVQLPGTVRTN